MTTPNYARLDDLFRVLSGTPGVLEPERYDDGSISFSHISQSREHYVLSVVRQDEHLMASTLFAAPEGHLVASAILCAYWDTWHTKAVLLLSEDGSNRIQLCSELNLKWSYVQAVEPFIKNLLLQLDPFFEAYKSSLEDFPSDDEIEGGGQSKSPTVFNSAMVGRIAETVITNWLTS